MSQSNLATFCFVLTNDKRTAQILEVQLLIRYLVLQVLLEFYSVIFNECVQCRSAQAERISFLPQINRSKNKKRVSPNHTV